MELIEFMQPQYTLPRLIIQSSLLSYLMIITMMMLTNKTVLKVTIYMIFVKAEKNFYIGKTV